jgi:hypothetical protein
MPAEVIDRIHVLARRLPAGITFTDRAGLHMPSLNDDIDGDEDDDSYHPGSDTENDLDDDSLGSGVGDDVPMAPAVGAIAGKNDLQPDPYPVQDDEQPGMICSLMICSPIPTLYRTTNNQTQSQVRTSHKSQVIRNNCS